MEHWDAQVNEWLEALEDVVENEGKEKAQALVQRVVEKARSYGVGMASAIDPSPYLNTYAAKEDSAFSGRVHSGKLEKWVLWNAMAMVVRAGKRDPSLGGHLSTFASASTLYRVGWDYFFRAHTPDRPGDLVYFQGHASPGVYAQSFLEGFFSSQDLDCFRQESKREGNGLSSYPHPRLMQDYWEFATVSMGLGPMFGIWTAKWLKYLHDRKIRPLDGRKVWVFCGDGEMDEPESRGALHVASDYGLDHLIFVVNCNLQRLDGPVRGNAKIMQQLERSFLGAGWRVIKVVWNSAWDAVFDADTTGLIAKYLHEIVDGAYQRLAAEGPLALVGDIIACYPETKAVFAAFSGEYLLTLGPGGHDHQKVYTAYHHALHASDGRPVCVLTHTQKGRGLGGRVAGANAAHQQKKMNEEALKQYAAFCGVASDFAENGNAEYYHPGEESPEIAWMHAQRKALLGYVPRRWQRQDLVEVPPRSVLEKVCNGTGRAQSTTMAYVRCLTAWLKHSGFKDVVVPIVADESRTFGMEGLFKAVGIYQPNGQQYTPVDAQQLTPYAELSEGILLQEGLNEAGAFSSWLSAATSYSHSQKVALPMYIYYSMFGFQRIGDMIWAAGDMRARGFLLGATSGRTTLPGEGLQHCDGQSMVMAGLHPSCVSYDVCYGYELGVILHHGAMRMLKEEEDVFYYLALGNEAYEMPEMPKASKSQDRTIEAMILEGMYPINGMLQEDGGVDVHLLGGGVLLREALKSSEVLKALGVRVKVWSVTSFTELSRNARVFGNLIVKEGKGPSPQKGKEAESKAGFLSQCLQGGAPVVAVSDHAVAYPEQIRAWIQNPMATLGTDGFGVSDTREALRKHFQVQESSITLQALRLLAETEQKWQRLFERFQLGVLRQRGNDAE